MREQEQENDQRKANGGESINWPLVALRSTAVTVEVFLHRRMGSRYVGVQGVLGIFVIYVFAAVVPAPGTFGVLLFLIAYLKACLWVRAGVIWRQLRGKDNSHSLYSGYPYLMKVLPRWNELTVKRFVEPLVVFLVGCAFAHFVPALALYLFMAAGALFLSVNLAEAYERRRVQQMHDALIEAQQRAERFRSLNGRR